MPLLFHVSSLLHNAEMDDEGLDYLCSRSEVQQDFELNADLSRAAGHWDLFFFFFLLFD